MSLKNLRMLRIPGVISLAMLLCACTPSTLSKGPSAGHLQAASVPKIQGAIPQPVQQSVLLPRPRIIGKTETYSVVVNNVQVHDLLFALARDARLNVDIHPGLTGLVTLNAIDQTLPQLLTRIAKQVDMRFEMEGPNLVVMPDSPYLKNYKVDYVNIARDVTGTVSTSTQISTSALTTGSGGAAGTGNTSRIQIDNKSKNRFWETLEKNLKELLHETDKIFPEGSTETVTEQTAAQSTTGTGTPAPTGTAARVVSQMVQSLAGSPNPATLQNTGASVVKRMTFREAASVIANPEGGVITVRATARQHEKVQEFLDRVMSGARRQVLIEATIIEVTLSDGYQQGIEWSRLTSGTDYSISKPTLTTNVPSTVTPYVIKYRQINPLNLLATVELLRAFGTVKVLSSPKLAVLNNQTATLKVSEDFVYFNVKQDVVPGNTNTNATVTTTTTPQSVSIGFFMSLTAQISDNGTVTLSVRPSISSIAELKQDPNPELAKNNIKNLVPQIRMREIESMMRVESGDIAVLGGLMEDRLDNRDGRLPGFGDIPFLGEVFNTRSNSSAKSELVVLLRPTVIRDASIEGDFSSFRESLPNRDFFKNDQVYRPFSSPDQPLEPLQ
ncbi:MAG: type II and III secretion system protein [Candidatus Accumulibacter phosphatis]|uniref:Pectic enzymes secretion protein OutD n=2 Tax=Candidatus Accumulibacter TaxID=327159 RepID=A0A080MAY9_9PROT|nr:MULTISPECIES: type II and III secretion system protein [Candidatus Accumulibacter]KFB78482.1 MAG: Pectic enzymes secretion protein OutD [Candidatus Accumulibacter cognatus]MBL8400817.1 type II and III secretion system protein [Accumulibacter sp.]MBN8516928.1 type II and III secretion system protein [Accumulibacter sp.]MBO3712318.1 type II and III secretion system protein [Accumulibacter sp.]MCC2867517.1 type II and III secretion system protein [Candidatus Accumulibacter phosphatis]